MKLYRILLATVASAIALASCSKVKNEVTTSEFDPNRTPVTSLTYVEEGSTNTKAVFEIDAAAAAQAGATSVTIFLARDMDDDILANGAFYKNVKIESEEPFQVTLDKITGDNGSTIALAKGDIFIPMIRANYPPFVHSEWTKVYALGSDRLALEVGYGLKAVVFEQPAGVDCKATDETIDVTWRRVPYAESYTLEYKKSSDSEWNVIDEISAKSNSRTIEGLVYSTPYDVRVKAVGDEEETEYTAASVTTEKTFKLRTKEQVIEFFTERAASAGAKDEFKLVNDVDMEGVSLPAVASYAGIFNGQGFALKNLKITEPLFTELNGTVKDFVIDQSCDIQPSVQFFAPLVSKNNGTVNGCINNAPVVFNSASSITGGVAISGLVVSNYGTVIGCKNTAEVKFEVKGTSESFGIAGIVAITASSIENCTNEGKVTCDLERCSARIAFSGMQGEKPAGCVGGIACYGIDGMSVKGCVNSGDIYYHLSKINGATGNINRNQVAGIIAAPSGDINNCKNTGTIKAEFCSTAGAFGTVEYIIGAAGISGGDYFAYNVEKKEKQNATNIVDCINEGLIDIYSDSYKANSTVAGIVAWPGTESKATNKTSNCQNVGDIFLKGTMKVRAGGIMGGSGNIESCQNAGNLHVGANINSVSVAGSVCGFHSGGYSLLNCSAFGSVVSEASINGCGGLSGAFGNTAMTISGCVNCELTNPNSASTGLVVGAFGGTKAITCGDAGSPIKVAGKVNGVSVTADNVEVLSHGTTNYSADSHTLFVVYGE